MRACMDLNQIVIFAKVAQTESFAGAARELSLPKSTVSRKLSDLERHLGARLIQRTTRKLSLTDAGRSYYEYALRIVDEIAAAERAISELQEAPRGLLRITVPIGFRFLGCMVARFLARYPEVEVALSCTDRVVHLVEEGFDLAIRAGHLEDSSLVAKLLGHERWLLVASPTYLQTIGSLERPEDLERCRTIVFFGGRIERTTWTLTRGGASHQVGLDSRLVVNDIDMVNEATLAGLGVGMLPASRCVEDIRMKRLVRVLPDWHMPAVPIHIVYPSSRHLSPKVRAFVDHMSESMSPPPWEVGPAP